MYRLAIILATILSSLGVKAQYYIKGQEPSHVTWNEHHASFGRLIYPKGLDSIASIYSQYMDSAWKVVPKTLSHAPKRTPILLHNNSILSNGFVSWAPRRMEVVTTPSHGASPVPWLQTLSLHETRHVVQIDKLNQGLTRLGFFLLGEQAVGAIAGIAPLWFLEGDAVYTETEYSYGGRGRQAQFYEYYRTHLLSNGKNKFPYDKWLMGSYKDMIPNHYSFGYLMVGYGNLKYGYNIWSNALEKTARQPFLINPFFFSLKKDIKLSPKNLFNENIQYLDSLWTTIDHKTDTTHTILTERKNKYDYVEYKTPVSLNDSMFVALKTSMKQTPRVIIRNINSPKEKKLFSPGQLTHKRISVTGNYIFWSEYRPHPRWEYENYSEIWFYDLNRGEKRKITNNSNYFNPIQISSSRIAVIEQKDNGANLISLINATGQKKDSITIPSPMELREICQGEGYQIFARCASPNGTVILRYKEDDLDPDTILGPVFRDISNIAYYNNKLFFTATENYVEQLFSVNTNTRKTVREFKSSYGLSDVSLSSDGDVFASIQAKGGSVPVKISLKNNNVPINFSKTIEPLYHHSKQNQPSHSKVLDLNYQDSILKPRKHHKISNLFRFHSWAPVYFNPFDVAAGKFDVPSPGVTLISQNLTSTLVSSFGYSYNQTHGVHAHVEWQGWYPKISASFNYGNEHAVFNGGPDPNETFGYRSEPKMNLNMRARLPYFFTAGATIFQANLGLQYSYTNTWLWDPQEQVYSDGLSTIEPYISTYVAKRMAIRDLRPRLGAYLYFGRSEFPKTKDLLGNGNFLSTRIYLPGFLYNQSLLLSGQWEKYNNGMYSLSPRLTFPRGHQKQTHDQAYSLNFDFSFPVAYTDLPIGPIVYVKRIFANIFSDNAWLSVYELENSIWRINQKTLRSAGMEINADVNFFRTPYQFRIGYRAGIIPEEKSYFHDFIISFDINSMYGYLSYNSLINLNL
ncbi:MAG: hypothetical protein ACLFNU_01555 [Bacteroidales bacterium]